MIETYTHRQIWLVPLVVLFSLCSHTSSWAQPCAPNCRDVNVPIYSDRMGTEFHAKVFWNDVLTDFDCVEPLDFMVTSQQGVLFAQGSSTDVGNEMYFIINNICPYSDKTLLLMITNSVGTCQSELTFTTTGAKLRGRSYTLYCDDPLLNEPVPGSGPLSIEICKGGQPTTWVSDWPEIRSCTEMGSDTAKIVYREWATTDADGHRRTAMDTMYVLRFPNVSPDNFFCTEKDTVYCADEESFGPYVLVPSTTTPNTCDTVRFLEITNSEGVLDFKLIDFSDKCGLTLHLDKTAFGTGCSQQYYVELEIKQDCGSAQDPNCMVTNSILEPVGSDGTYWRCSFWLSLLDTVPPIATCDLTSFDPGALIWPMGTGLDSLEHCWDTPVRPGSDSLAPVVLLSTKVHDCAATAKLPPLCVYDQCSDVQAVKASIEGVGTYVFSQGDSCTGGFTYAYDQGVHLPMREMPYQVIYEVLDQCHNIDTIYCYLQVKDVTKPVAVSEKGVIVNLSTGSSKYEKKTWVDASTFDEGSWDNCGIALMLARRSDWYESCINLCDIVIDTCTYHGMDLKMAYLDIDSENPVEAHYAREMKWLEEDGEVCSQLLLDAWKLDLLYFGSTSCGSFEYDRESFSVLLEEDFCDLGLQGSPGRLFGCTEQDTIHEGRYRKASLLGGGWTKAVPFDCADACSNVTVELLVMDYWCNWSKSWTDVWVEDQNPIKIVQDLSDVEISCQSFRANTHIIEGYSGPVSIETLVDAAVAGETAALNGLDELLGGYEKGWIDSYGNVVDDGGVRLDSTISFEDSICICDDSLMKFKVYDEHFGEIWKDSLVSFCYYDKELKPIDGGLIAVNCSEGVICDQTVWADIDHCGQGYIYRKFSISASCPATPDGYNQGHTSDTITKMQSIWVGNSCELDVGMFDLPSDQTIYTCGITYADDRSGHVTGDADPTLTGRPVYKFDDDCRIVGIAHEDKVFRVVGGDQACFKVIRTWYMADWCHQEKPAVDSWWKRDGITLDTFVQKILVIDTLAPVCIIAGPVEDGGTIDAAGCVYNLSVVLDAMDACGSLSYYYELREITDINEPLMVRQGRGDASDGSLEGIEISEEDLEGGHYRLVVYVTDQCQNEGICAYEVTIFTGKKPSPVCISSLTADLVPMDLNGDGTIDTAMSVVWAKEFDASSTAPCGYADEDLKFFIEILGDGNGAFETLDTTVDKDRLELGCQHMGFNTVRFWVLSPSGSVDFCDVTLVVQNNMGGCPEVVQQVATISGQILTEDDLPIPAVSLGSISTQGFGQQDLTDDLGMYSMMSLMGDSVVITPSKDDTPQNGVSTADILPIFFHANQTTLLESPYLRIAADVNGDQIVNAVDLLEVRNMVLGNITEWSGSPNWKFIRSDYVFTSEVPESEDYAKSFAARLVAAQIAANFIGMKTGDMDLDRGLESSRNAEVVVIEGADAEFMGDGKATISLSLPQRDFAGIQLSLRYDPTKLGFDHFDLNESIVVDELNFGWNEIEEGLLVFSWINAEPNQQLDIDAFLTLTFETRGSGKLSDHLTLGDKRVQSEAYGQDWAADPIALRFIGDERRFSLQQNQPNPFKTETDIPFELTEMDGVSLLIHDVRGRLIKRVEVDAFEGQQITQITAEDIGGQPGVYYYSLVTTSGTDTKKMVLLK